MGPPSSNIDGGRTLRRLHLQGKQTEAERKQEENGGEGRTSFMDKTLRSEGYQKRGSDSSGANA